MIGMMWILDILSSRIKTGKNVLIAYAVPVSLMKREDSYGGQEKIQIPVILILQTGKSATNTFGQCCITEMYGEMHGIERGRPMPLVWMFRETDLFGFIREILCPIA